MTIKSLKVRTLKLLQELREEEGSCYYGLNYLVNKLGCDPLELYNWDDDSGVLYELERRGLVSIAHGKEPAFIACGEMDWGSGF